MGETRAVELARVLMLEQAGPDLFAANTPEWYGPRVFGGFIVGQALSAMCATVEDARRPHSMHGHFLRPLASGQPTELTVERVRDGRSFSTRTVTTRQGGKDAFVGTASFHEDEVGDEYELPISPTAGNPEELEQSEWGREGPFDERDLGPDGPDENGLYRSTGRRWFRITDSIGDNPDLHAAAIAYMSDMTGNAFRPRSLDAWEGYMDASLDHALWLHRPPRVDEWMFFELNALVNAGGRGVVRGTIHTRYGRLVASMAQELLVRAVEVGAVGRGGHIVEGPA